MGLFNIFRGETRTGPTADEITALGLRVATLERELKSLDAEWTEMYDKFRRLHMRLAKRDQRAEDGSGSTIDPKPEELSIGARRLLGRL